jgi:Zn-dependent M16 (insulinase) family peptidase
MEGRIVLKKLLLVASSLIMVMCMNSFLQAGTDLESLKDGQNIHGFSVMNLYENGSGKAMGARFVSEKYGFVIDLMQIQSVPQGFFWVKTPPTTDMGEAHTCEHLLLGKGAAGRYVAALEDMALGSSTAYTSQKYTAYHFNTVAGMETFYKLFEAKLDAFLKPDFTDEEIRREVCHIGINSDQETGELDLDEKGTVYTEMVSSFEKPGRELWMEMGKLLYGDDHPLSLSSGGYPPELRKMKPADLWKFHKENYQLGNMGAIVAIPDDITVESFLERIEQSLSNCQSFVKKTKFTGIGNFDIPPAKSTKEEGVIKVLGYASNNPEDPGQIMFSWPANLENTNYESFVLDLFLETFTSGATSNLYDLFINSQTRKIDLGANYVFGYHADDLGNPIMIGIDGLRNEFVTEKMIDSLRSMIIEEIQRVYDFDDDSEEIKKFNELAKGRLIQNRKQYEKYLNSPPMFGFRRSSAGGWVSNLQFLEKEEGFRKSMVLKNHFDKLENQLQSDDNFWRAFLDHYMLLEVNPIAGGVKPDASLIQATIDEKSARIAGYIDDFKNKYAINDEQQAIAKYKEEFDKNTEILDNMAAKDELPEFIDNPPLTLDDQLNYEVIKLDNGVEMVSSIFDNMTSSTLGLALRLDVIPESKLVYVAYLRTILTGLGVIKDGEVLSYEDMRNRLREEVLGLNSYFDYGYESGRIELVLKVSGNNLDEMFNGLEWMNASLYSPYLDVENIPRMVDVLDQTLVSFRNTMKGSEEDWVRLPARAYRYQTNPLIMATNCFLTKTHDFQRLKWFLTDPGSEQEKKELFTYLDKLAAAGNGLDRAKLTELLDNPPEMPSLEKCRDILTSVLISLKSTMSEIPDETLADDWEYLLNQTQKDIAVEPKKAIEDMKSILALISKADNARLFMISNSADKAAVMNKINGFVSKLDQRTKSTRIKYAENARIIDRLRSRVGAIDKPVYVGMVNPNTRNGVMVFSARNSDVMDLSDEAILNCLASKLYGGGGGHGLFMRTWGAGLAYSNGYGFGSRSGNAAYYAERCPDIAETMRFVVSVLEDAEEDPKLAEYCIAQIFGASRAPSRYESRGESMAADLVDGFGPEREKEYRLKILEQMKKQDLYKELFNRMETVYGPVLIGYGKPLSESREGNFFIIGPDEQFESLENYIKTVEQPQTVYKLYPRDFWLTI